MHRKITIIYMLWRMLTCLKWSSLSASGKCGVLMLLLNVPLGWGGAAICAVLAAMYQDSAKFYGILAVVVYGISWLVLVLGVVLAGKPAVEKLKVRRKAVLAACRRYNQMYDNRAQS